MSTTRNPSLTTSTNKDIPSLTAQVKYMQLQIQHANIKNKNSHKANNVSYCKVKTAPRSFVTTWGKDTPFSTKSDFLKWKYTAPTSNYTMCLKNDTNYTWKGKHD